MYIKLIFAIVVISVFSAFVSGQRSITLEELRNMKKENSPKPAPTPEPAEPSPTEGTKTTFIADGSFSKVEKPFVFVARDRETYLMLGSLIGDFNADKEIDYDKYAVVAAFSGAKDTGGYSVSITMRDGICEIEDVAPVHGAIVTEAITYPFSMVLVPVEEQDPLELATDDTWKQSMDLYDVSSGEFEFSGGFIGMTKKFGISGTVGVLRNGPHVSFFFELYEEGEDPVRKLLETGSGLLDEKMPEIRRLEAGDLIDRPHPPLKVDAKFTGNRIEMEFIPGTRDYVVNDGFEGKGKLTAVKRTVE